MLPECTAVFSESANAVINSLGQSWPSQRLVLTGDLKPRTVAVR